MTAAPTVDLIVLAGGRASRLDGAVKPAVAVAGRTLLARVLDARPLVRRVVIVGPDAARAAATGHDALWALEDPPFGGPVAGIAAGLGALDSPDSAPADWLLVLACDLPWAADAARALIAALPALPPAVQGLYLEDPDGRAQWLAAAYRPAPLADAARRLGPRSHGASMRQLLEGLTLRGIRDEVGASRDVDTWQDVRESTALLTGAPDSPRSTHMSTPPPPLPPEALDEWLLALAEHLGLDASEVPVAALLDVARDVAHNVARPAAPLSTFLVGLAAARNGGTRADVEKACSDASTLALTWTGEKR